MSAADHIEIHPPAGDELCFGPETGWIVPSGYGFEFSGDGSLRILNPSGEEIWSSETAGLGATRLCFKDGALWLHSPDEAQPLWSTNTAGHPGAFLAFQNDGNLVVYSAGREALWATGTNGK